MKDIELYEIIRKIANTSDSELIEKFGTCDFYEIILRHSMYDLLRIWYSNDTQVIQNKKKEKQTRFNRIKK